MLSLLILLALNLTDAVRFKFLNGNDQEDSVNVHTQEITKGLSFAMQFTPETRQFDLNVALQHLQNNFKFYSTCFYEHFDPIHNYRECKTSGYFFRNRFSTHYLPKSTGLKLPNFGVWNFYDFESKLEISWTGAFDNSLIPRRVKYENQLYFAVKDFAVRTKRHNNNGVMFATQDFSDALVLKPIGTWHKVLPYEATPTPDNGWMIDPTFWIHINTDDISNAIYFKKYEVYTKKLECTLLKWIAKNALKYKFSENEIKFNKL